MHSSWILTRFECSRTHIPQIHLILPSGCSQITGGSANDVAAQTSWVIELCFNVRNVNNITDHTDDTDHHLYFIMTQSPPVISLKYLYKCFLQKPSQMVLCNRDHLASLVTELVPLCEFIVDPFKSNSIKNAHPLKQWYFPFTFTCELKSLNYNSEGVKKQNANKYLICMHIVYPVTCHSSLTACINKAAKYRDTIMFSFTHWPHTHNDSL